MTKREALFLSSVIALVLISAIASAAGDVAYVYSKKSGIDQKIVQIFRDSGLSVDLILESKLPKNLSGYKFLFVGDERFRDAQKIPVNDYPSIVINSYYGRDWGLTDAEGVSALASNSPLRVQINSHETQVYTQAFDRRGIALDYLFLDDLNKAPMLQRVAATQVTSSGDKIGDVISYAAPGAAMLNRKAQKGKLCFYGIENTQYWTSAAENLFGDCLGYVASECTVDEDCPGESISEPFCANGSVYRTRTNYGCVNPGEVNAECVAHNVDELVEHCEFGCENARCLPGIHDVALVDFAGAIDKILIEEENGSDVLGNQIICNRSYRFAVTVENQGNFSENVTFVGSIGDVNVTPEPVENILPWERVESHRIARVSLGEGNYTIVIEAILHNDSNQMNNVAQRDVFVYCPQINCTTNEDCNDQNSSTEDVCHNPGTSDSYCTNEPIRCSANIDCGVDGFVGELFCTGKNVTQNYQIFTCNNPGSSNSSCSDRIELRVKEECSDFCLNGSCGDFVCDSDDDCADQNPLTIDRCVNPGTPIAECQHIPINCASDADCGFTGFIGQEFCSMSDVFKNFQTATCNYPGTLNSSCSVTVEQRLVQDCVSTCANGTCIRCNSDADCNDGNSSTQDVCHNPGTPESYCSNDEVRCSANIDCGVDGFIGELFCTGKNVTQNYQIFTCNNPGSSNSSCLDRIELRVKEECSDFCLNGSCGDFVCDSDDDCDDNNPLTLDECINPGTPASECRNTLVNCASDDDCGFTGFLGQEFCSGNGVYKNYQESICNYPGTLNSSCSINVTQNLLTECEFACADGGICVRCDSDYDCDDGNPGTHDQCKNPGTIFSYCSNEPTACRNDSDCGITGFIGDPFCNADDVFKLFQTAICNNPGLPNASCNVNTSVMLFEDCEFTCANGECIRCNTNSDCNDQNSSTEDVCHNPGTSDSYCTNEPIRCSANIDCGVDGFVGELFCTGKNVTQNYQIFTCNNPGSSNSSCSDRIELRVKEECSDFCLNGSCGDFVCDSDDDCADQNPLTIDRCVNPGTPIAECQHIPINCASDADCGFTGFIGQEFCSMSDVFKNFQTATCNYPGTLNSSCSVTVEQRLVQDCVSTCANGTCIRCNSDADCNDGNSSTQDVCHNPGTPESYCSNEPSGECIPGQMMQCGFNNIGECRLGNKTCDYGGHWGACVGAIFPSSEVCDGKDNDCDGIIDNGNLCGPGQSCVAGHCTENCSNECVLGNRDCQGNGYRVCGNYDADSCTEWSTPTNCGYGQICVGGVCVGGCTSECTDGSVRCQGNGFQTCHDYNGDGCTEWGSITQCGSGQICSNGLCIPGGCTNECANGQRICQGNAFRVCGNYDPDSCFEWGTLTNCAAGQLCQNGYCVTQCTSQCNDGDRQCVGNGFRICHDYNGDGCTEWSNPTQCGSGQTCQNGQCVQTCSSQCIDGSRQCNGNGFQICHDYNGDGCTEWSNPTQCGYGKICVGGVCI